MTFDGITLNIIDTAGIRDTADKVEKIGVEKARREIELADLILCVIDTSIPLTKEDEDIFHSVRGKRKIILLNKSDMEAITGFAEIEPYIEKEDIAVNVSAKYHTGIDDFMNAVKSLMFQGKIDTDHEIYITNARHNNLLMEALSDMDCLIGSIRDDMPEDFFTIDMMNAYERLGLIIGESVEEDLVNEIFSRFCTGK